MKQRLGSLTDRLSVNMLWRSFLKQGKLSMVVNIIVMCMTMSLFNSCIESDVKDIDSDELIGVWSVTADDLGYDVDDDEPDKAYFYFKEGGDFVLLSFVKDKLQGRTNGNWEYDNGYITVSLNAGFDRVPWMVLWVDNVNSTTLTVTMTMSGEWNEEDDEDSWWDFENETVVMHKCPLEEIEPYLDYDKTPDFTGVWKWECLDYNNEENQLLVYFYFIDSTHCHVITFINGELQANVPDATWTSTFYPGLGYDEEVLFDVTLLTVRGGNDGIQLLITDSSDSEMSAIYRSYYVTMYKCPLSEIEKYL